MTTKTNLYQASSQWANRPSDERFWDLNDLQSFLSAERKASVEKTVPLVTMRPKAFGDEICLVNPDKGVPCRLNNWSFSQLCEYAKGKNDTSAPSNYLRSLPPELAVKCLTYGLDRPEVSNIQLLMHDSGTKQHGTWTARAVTSTDYSRLWNIDLVNALKPAVQAGWRTPPARPYPGGENDPRTRKATEADIIKNQGNFGLNVKVGDPIQPAGVYAGDRDMFIFMIHPEKIIDDGGSGLMRGVFIHNSEVRACSFRAVAFMMESVCGNHIVWNASKVTEFKFYHRGDIYSRFRQAINTNLHEYIEHDTGDEEAMIKKARQLVLGKNVEEASEKLFNNKKFGLTLDLIKQGMEAAAKWEHTALAPPTTAWGFVHGLTRISQETQYADRRAKIDASAGKILALAV